MNKYQEALNSIIWRLTSHEEDLELRPTAKEDIAILQELVDKETPKKPIEKIISDAYDYDGQGTFKNKIIQCPNCEFELYNEYECIDYTFNYCPNCGQKIDWSDEK